MATTLRASNSNSSTTGTAVSVTAPTGTTAGDVVIVSVHANNQTTIADNNGATSFTEDINDYKPNTSGGHTLSIFSRRIQTGDPTTYAFTIGASGRWSIIADTWQNPNATDIYDVAPSTSNAANADNSSAATINAPAITTNTANAIHVVHGYFDDGTAGNPSGPAGYTAAGADNDEPQGAFYKVIASAGTTGAQTVTGTTSAPRIALSYAVKDIGGTNVTVNAGVQSKTLNLLSPTVTAVRNPTVSAGVQTKTFAIQAPTVTTIRNASISADTESKTFSIPTPTITVGDSVTPAANTASFSIPSPTVTTTRSATINADVLTNTFSIPTPTAGPETIDVTIYAPLFTFGKRMVFDDRFRLMMKLKDNLFLKL